MGRGITDVIFSSICLQLNLYQVFIDLKRAFDTVNRKTPRKVLQKCSYPDEYFTSHRIIHEDMKGIFTGRGKISELTSINNGV